ncbi:MAG: response regulator [Thermodesulfobacteriota bacterium]|nr:response regulator [Thermodesulfobacteriota bacterium]
MDMDDILVRKQSQLLFVDDEPALLTSIKRLLHGVSDNWEIHFATSVEQALDIINRIVIDIIITDMNMPAKTGFDLLMMLREQKQTRDLPVLIMTGNTETELKTEALELGATDLLMKPISKAHLLSRIRNMLKLKSYQDEIKQHNRLLDAKVKARTQELEDSRLDMIWRLAKAAECRDTDTGNHIFRVAHYCRILAKNLGLDSDFIERIFQASPLHDIGKIGIPDSILLKSGKLSAGEYKTMQTHCNIGAEILRHDVAPSLLVEGSVTDGSDPTATLQDRNPLLFMAANIALYHHEHWDGNGYPTASTGDAIPLSARICAIADVFDALSTARPYKQALAEQKVLDIMREGCAQQFDPTIFRCFADSFSEFRKVRDNLADDGSKG